MITDVDMKSILSYDNHTDASINLLSHKQIIKMCFKVIIYTKQTFEAIALISLH